MRDRFVQDGHKFYFPDGAPAFKDRGRRLSTPSENTQVVHSLVEIARSRGWSEVTVSGTDRFARKPGGRRDSPVFRSGAIGRMTPSGRVDSRAGAGTSTGVRFRGGCDSQRLLPPQSRPPYRPRRGNARPGSVERIKGRLLEHGRDAYRHDPDQQLSYFVRLQTPDGTREVWGKDIERAVHAVSDATEDWPGGRSSTHGTEMR